MDELGKAVELAPELDHVITTHGALLLTASTYYFQLDANIPPLQMRKLGLREVNYFVQGYKGRKSELGSDPTPRVLQLSPKTCEPDDNSVDL